jgi:CDP-paratose synthetase
MRILLTGVTGYLGSHLAETLLASDCEVVALKRDSSSLRRIEHLLPKLTLHDVTAVDMDALFTQDGKFDAVVHTATCYGRNGESANQIAEANLAFPLKLLDAAVASGVGLFINTDTVLNKMLNPYALSKGQFAEWGHYFAQQKKIHFINLKLEHFYGPGDDKTKFTTHIINSCLSSVPELKLTLGEQLRDFIHIDDVVSAYLLFNKRDSFDDEFVEFEVGSGAAVSIRQLVQTIHRLTASTTRLNFGAQPYRVGEAMFSQADTQSLQALGWHCRYDIETGLKLVIDQERKAS